VNLNKSQPEEKKGANLNKLQSEASKKPVKKKKI